MFGGDYWRPETVASREILLTRPWSTLPGPSSTNSVAPSATMFCTVWVQRTGAVSCATRLALISAGSVWGSASTFWYTGHTGVWISVASMADASSARDGYMRGECKAPPTFKGSARFAPAALAASHAAAMASISPEITICPGQL